MVMPIKDLKLDGAAGAGAVGGRRPTAVPAPAAALLSCRIGRAGGRSPSGTSCGFWPRSIAPPPEAPAPSCAGKVCTRRP